MSDTDAAIQADAVKGADASEKPEDPRAALLSAIVKNGEDVAELLKALDLGDDGPVRKALAAAGKNRGTIAVYIRQLKGETVAGRKPEAPSLAKVKESFRAIPEPRPDGTAPAKRATALPRSKVDELRTVLGSGPDWERFMSGLRSELECLCARFAPADRPQSPEDWQAFTELWLATRYSVRGNSGRALWDDTAEAPEEARESARVRTAWNQLAKARSTVTTADMYGDDAYLNALFTLDAERAWVHVEPEWVRRRRARERPFLAPALIIPRSLRPNDRLEVAGRRVVIVRPQTSPVGQVEFDFAVPLERAAELVTCPEEFFGLLARMFTPIEWRHYLALHYLAHDQREFWYAPGLVLDAEAGRRQQEGSTSRHDARQVRNVDEAVEAFTNISITLQGATRDEFKGLIQAGGWERRDPHQRGRRPLVRMEHSEPLWKLREGSFIPLPPDALAIEPRRLALLWALLVRARVSVRRAHIAKSRPWSIPAADAIRDAGLKVQRHDPGRSGQLVTEALEDGRARNLIEGELAPNGARVISYTVSPAILKAFRAIPPAGKGKH